MQYVRSIGGSVSKTWNSINPATLSGAIDVVVVEQEDGTLACSPFHVRFGKFSLLRPSEKKVEFKVNGVKQDYPMKLGEGGEAFFVFETFADIPVALQTSPVISPTTSPSLSQEKLVDGDPLSEPDPLDLDAGAPRPRRPRPTSAIFESKGIPIINAPPRAQDDLGMDLRSKLRRELIFIGSITPVSGSPPGDEGRLASSWSPKRHLQSVSDDFLSELDIKQSLAMRDPQGSTSTEQMPEFLPQQLRPLAAARLRSNSPPPVTTQEAVNRAIALSKKLSISNIRSKVTDSGDLMLDMEGYKSSEEEALRAELIARKVLAEELQGNYDIGALIGADERGNLWIYSSEEAKVAAAIRKGPKHVVMENFLDDAASDPGHQSDDERSVAGTSVAPLLQQEASTRPAVGLVTPPKTPPDAADAAIASESSVNYAKTLRLTSDQLKALNLKPGANSMSFSVNRATCQASMFYWTHDVPVVISDIDGTITK